MSVMGKLTSWFRQGQHVRKAAGEVEAAYIAHVRSEFEDDPELVGVLTSTYSLTRIGESPAGTLWQVDSGWGVTYVLDSPDGTDVFVAVARSGNTVAVDEAVLERVERTAGVDAGTLDLDALARFDSRALLAFLNQTPPLKRHAVVKADAAQQYTLGIAYFADEIDAHGDFTSAAELERAAWEYMRNSRNVGVMHEDGTDDAGTVVESYIYRGPDWHVADQTVKDGDWLLGVQWKDEAWARIEAGELTGFSIQGYALKDDDGAVS